MSSFHLKLTPSTVLAALEKLRAGRPSTWEKMEAFIFRNPAGWAFTATGLGELLPGNDDRTSKANRGRGNLFLGQELGAWFAEELGLIEEIDARASDLGPNLPGKCLAMFTWDSVNICNGGESGTEPEVTFVLRPEYAAAFSLMSAKAQAIAE